MQNIATNTALLLLLSLLVDLIYGEYPLKLHPVHYIGRAISFLTKFGERKKRANIYGAFIFIIITLLFSSIAFLLLTALNGIPKLILGALILKSTFSFRMLRSTALSIMHEIEGENIKKARKMLKSLVGRETEKLSEELCISAVIESIGDSLCDSIVAPLFYFFFFSFHSMELGVSAAVFYRAANTLDSMIGYENIAFGKFSAKADEVLNLVPARISAFLLLLSGTILRKDIRRALHVFLFERFKTPSINSGQGIAMLAGLLRVRLEKKGVYEIGEARERLIVEKIKESVRLLDISTFLFFFILTAYYLSHACKLNINL